MTKQTLEEAQKKAIDPKKGGPYTEQEKLIRRNKVYNLHFEKGYSALRIAEDLGVNRNTINSDIKELYIQFADELPDHEVAGLFLSQIHAFKFQKARLVEKIEKQNEPKIQMQLEKIISDIDYRIGQIVVKLMKGKYGVVTSIRVKERLTKEKEE